MKVELLVTLKGTTTWRRGTVFDDAVSPIPGDILREIDNPQVIRVIPESPFAVPRNEETAFEWGMLPEVNNYDDDASEIEMEPEPEVEEEQPDEAEVKLTFGSVDAQMNNLRNLLKDDEKEYLIELNALIDQSSLKRAAVILDAPYQRLAMWRAKRKEPTEEEIQKIHEEYAKVSE